MCATRWLARQAGKLRAARSSERRLQALRAVHEQEISDVKEPVPRIERIGKLFGSFENHHDVLEAHRRFGVG